MKKYYWIGFIILSAFNMTAYAFSSVDEQIDHYLEILESGSNADKVKMLERLQWSGLSEPRLYDEVEQQVNFLGFSKQLNNDPISLLSHQIRALGYSGNEKYRSTLVNIKDNAKISKLKRHAKKALMQLDQFIGWNQSIKTSDIGTEGKSVEVATYMRMLNVDDVFVQRLAARAIFHEQRQDSDLLALTAEKLKNVYMKEGLDSQTQDTAAWFCKAIGQSGQYEYLDLLREVNEKTPYRKIKKYALQFIK
jgi:hypothetical protein